MDVIKNLEQAREGIAEQFHVIAQAEINKDDIPRTIKTMKRLGESYVTVTSALLSYTGDHITYNNFQIEKHKREDLRHDQN